MSLGSILLVGTTLGIAALDGGLTALVVAAGIGGGTYVLARRDFAVPSNGVAAMQLQLLKTNLENQLQGETDPDTIRRHKKVYEEQVAKVEVTVNKQRYFAKEISTIAGVAGVACPPLGLAAIGLLTADRWVPYVEELGRNPNSIPTQSAPIKHRPGDLLLSAYTLPIKAVK